MGSAADNEQPGVKRNILNATDLLDFYLCGRWHFSLDCVKSEMKRLLDLVLNESDIRPTITYSMNMVLLGLVISSELPNKVLHCPS